MLRSLMHEKASKPKQGASRQGGTASNTIIKEAQGGTKREGKQFQILSITRLLPPLSLSLPTLPCRLLGFLSPLYSVV